MEILRQLGANETAFIQFIIFIVSISFLTVFVYGPYYRAYDQRLKQTKGADLVATETQEEAKKIESIFQSRAREINQKIKTIFDNSRNQASVKMNSTLEQAKTKATELIEGARKETEHQKQLAQKDISTISNEIAAEISKKLTGTV